jgi:hypothetical protein
MHNGCGKRQIEVKMKAGMRRVMDWQEVRQAMREDWSLVLMLVSAVSFAVASATGGIASGICGLAAPHAAEATGGFIERIVIGSLGLIVISWGVWRCLRAAFHRGAL